MSSYEEKDVAKYMASCDAAKSLHIPNLVREDISVDFMEGFPKSIGFETVLVVVDRLTKHAHVPGLKHLFIVTQ